MIGDKPAYEPVVDKWRGKPFDLGLFWLGGGEPPFTGVISHPYMIDVMAMPQDERNEFVRYVENRLRELRAAK